MTNEEMYTIHSIRSNCGYIRGSKSITRSEEHAISTSNRNNVWCEMHREFSREDNIRMVHPRRMNMINNLRTPTSCFREYCVESEIIRIPIELNWNANRIKGNLEIPHPLWPSSIFLLDWWTFGVPISLWWTLDRQNCMAVSRSLFRMPLMVSASTASLYLHINYSLSEIEFPPSMMSLTQLENSSNNSSNCQLEGV